MPNLTVEQVIEKAGGATKIPGRKGAFRLNKKVALSLNINSPYGRIKYGEIVHVDVVDINGKYPRTVHLAEKGFWWKVCRFKLAKEPLKNPIDRQ